MASSNVESAFANHIRAFITIIDAEINGNTAMLRGNEPKTAWDIRCEVEKAYDYKYPQTKEFRQKIPEELWLRFNDVLAVVNADRTKRNKLYETITKELNQTPVGANWSESHFRSLLSHIAQELKP